MGQAKDDAIRREEARTAAAAAKGRICARCDAVIEFDDAEPTSKAMLCSRCRAQMAKDD